MIIVECQANLLEIVGTADAVGRLADLLHRGHEQAHQECDDRNDDQQLDEREAGATRAGTTPEHGIPPL